MKSKTLIVALLAVLVVPAAGFGKVTAQDRENGARSCRALRASIGVDLFKQSYGTAASNRQNAFGKCVSQWARSEHQSRVSAQAACSAERSDPNFAASHDGKTFAAFYGLGKKGANAFGRCVSSKARAASLEKRERTVNAARQCRTERGTLGRAEFRMKYGTGARDRNAFGKCVSALATAPAA
jgi:hypothetical protein